jgi:hypothetical protein
MTDQGKLEILGLKKWNAQTLVDSMKTLAGAKPLHACAGQMVHDFGFAEVSVMFVAKDYTVACIIEDNSDGKLNYLKPSADKLPIMNDYKGIAEILENNFKIYNIGLQTYKMVKKGELDKAESRISNYKDMAKDIETFWKFLKSKNKVSDMNLAFWVLNNDSNIMNSCIAMAILTNFVEYDAVWWEMLNLQRVKNDTMRYFAATLMQNMNDDIRTVDWEAAVVPIKYLLSGTNLFLFYNIVGILTKTEISQGLAERVLSGSTRILNLYLNGSHEVTRKIAINFIRQISGDENLTSAEDCKKWLKQFENES